MHAGGASSEKQTQPMAAGNVSIEGANMKNLMLDLETLGTRPGCVILSIGAVFFDIEEGLGAEFHAVVSRVESEKAGLLVSQDTVDWWDKQSDEAKTTLHEASSEEAWAPKDVFAAFNGFLQTYGDPKKVLIWGNGADFDNVLLLAAYEKVGCAVGWGNYNNRCYRTLKNLRRGIKLERQGTYHNALDDAKTQATHTIQLLKAIGDA